MKLTLGQAAKKAGISKPSLSAAIKKGRLSAYKNESGTYEIDPAELFRVYPPKANTNGLDESNSLPETNPKNIPVSYRKDETLALLLDEKDAAIKRLEQEKEAVRQDLEDQKEQTKRMTLLLEDKSGKPDEWQQAFKALEDRIANQEQKASEERQKVLDQNKALKKALAVEKSKTVWQKLFG